jgi:hypothetical protein
MPTGDPDTPIDPNPIQEAIRLDILIDAHNKLLKINAELESIADAQAQALSLISLKKPIEEPMSFQVERGYQHYLQFVFEALNRYIHFKSKYKPKNKIESETA